MNKMNDNGSNNEGNKKSLMNTLAVLENTAMALTDLSRHSGEILHMVSSPRGNPLPTPADKEVIPADGGKDIVDLFDDVNTSIGESIIKIRSNLEELKLIIK